LSPGNHTFTGDQLTVPCYIIVMYTFILSNMS